MTTFFSTAYTSNGVNQTEPTNPSHLSPAAVDGGRVAYRRCSFDLSGESSAIGDEFHFFRVRSGDSMVRLYMSDPGFFSVDMKMDLGYYETGAGDVGGAVVDATVHGETIFMDVGNAQFDVFNQGGNIGDEDRGLPIWQLLNAAGASYSVDPLQEWHLVGVQRAENSNNGGAIMIEMYYLPAGG